MFSPFLPHIPTDRIPNNPFLPQYIFYLGCQSPPWSRFSYPPRTPFFGPKPSKWASKGQKNLARRPRPSLPTSNLRMRALDRHIRIKISLGIYGQNHKMAVDKALLGGPDLLCILKMVSLILVILIINHIIEVVYEKFFKSVSSFCSYVSFR
jgi:hypothetical protein